MIISGKPHRARGAAAGDDNTGLELLADARERFFELPAKKLDQTFASARLTRAISLHVARQFAFPATGEIALDPVSYEPEITGRVVRGVLTRCAVSHKGLFPSDRAGGDLPWEQRCELYALQRLDCMEGVTAICTQPVAAEYTCPFTRRRRQAFPDIYVECDGTPLLYEIKKDLSNLKMDGAIRLVLLEHLFGRAGVQYRLWRDAEIREEPAYGNAVWLGRFKTVSLTDTDRMALRQLFAGRPEQHLQAVAEGLGDPDRARSYAMLLRNWLLPEPDVDIREDPLVCLNPRLVGAR